MQIRTRNLISSFVFCQNEAGEDEIAFPPTWPYSISDPSATVPMSTVLNKDLGQYETAMKNVGDSTGVCPETDIEPFLRGKPFRFYNKAVGETWHVRCYSWRLRGGKDLLPGWRWVQPGVVLEGQMLNEHASPLLKALKTTWIADGVLFENWQSRSSLSQPAHVLKNSLEALKNDSVSGARHMAGMAVQSFSDILQSFKPYDDVKKDWEQIRIIAWHLIHNGRPNMNAAIEAAMLTILRKVHTLLPNREAIQDELRESMFGRRASGEQIPDNFTKYLDQHVANRKEQNEDFSIISILTLSSSITKRAIIKALRRPDIRIDLRILESRPLCEGAQMAADLLQALTPAEQNRIKVTIGTDASVAVLARDVELVVLGADKISDRGDVSNKTGSLPAILCARAAGRQPAIVPKVIILAGTEKIAKPGSELDFPAENDAPCNVWRIWERAGCKGEIVSKMQNHARVEFKTVLFEWIPAEYVDVYMTERGQIDAAQITEHSFAVRNLELEIFDN